MKVFCHVVTHDYGFAPNPYAGTLSLATCKPRIRSLAAVGDWVIGVGSVRSVGGERLVYALLIDEIVPLDVYGREDRFVVKRPTFRGEPWQSVGDNIYYRNGAGTWEQRTSLHNISHMQRDLSGRNVLLGHEFYYFGAAAPVLPTQLAALASPGRGHRLFRDPELAQELENWLRTTFSRGILGEPFHHRRRPRTRSRAMSSGARGQRAKAN